MATSLYGTSFSSIYAKELKNIREEQEVEEEQRLAKKEGRKVVGGGLMQVQSYLGKGAKKLASKKLEEAAQFVMDNKVQSIKKFEGVAGSTPEIFDKMGSFGDVGKGLWEGFESYTGMSFGGEATQLTSEYLSAAITSGEGAAEVGIGKVADLFKPVSTVSRAPGGPLVRSTSPILPGTPEATKDIFATLGQEQVKVGTATLGEGGKITSEILETGIEEVTKGSATASAGALAGQAAAGLGIATGGFQAISGFAEGDTQAGLAGTAKAIGGAMMLAPPLAPVGLALTGIGTLLDFI